MGALENSGDGRTFLNTFKGKFTKRANSETTGAVSRINKNNKEVWELQFDTLRDVIIQEFERRDSEDYGLSWNIKLADSKSDDQFTLTLPYSGRITMGLFFRLPNTDINAPLTMKLYHFEEDDKTALVIYQDGNKVEAYWTKDTPHDMPDLEQKTVNNKKVWDSSARMKYLETYLAKDVVPKMNDFAASPSDLNQDVVAEEVSQEPKESSKTPIWDADAGCLKREWTDKKWYETDEKGVFKRDQDGKMIEALPF